MTKSASARKRAQEAAQARAQERARRARQRRFRVLIGAALGVLVVAGLAGWTLLNGQSDDTEPTGDNQALSADDQQMLDYTQCMREHGVDMPDPEPGGPIKIESPFGNGFMRVGCLGGFGLVVWS